LSKSTFITQGFGNAGSWASELLGRHGAKLLATCDSRSAIANSKGFEINALKRHYATTHDLSSFPGAESISVEEFWKTKADILIPAALENQITSKNVADIDVRVIAEAANGPTTLAADQALADRGVAIIPDILCNAGGVIVSYFEWVQNKKSEHWELSEVDAKLERLIKGAYRRVIEMKKDRGISTRTAAFAVALQRIRAAYLQRQVFP
jgi:glutamate dehydrogenase (NAD(P)+)